MNYLGFPVLVTPLGPSLHYSKTETILHPVTAQTQRDYRASRNMRLFKSSVESSQMLFTDPPIDQFQDGGECGV
jgi:hypothetical protein